MKVERRKYRFRILNASISRSFLLKLSTGDPLYVIGTDGGLMPAPQATTSLRHGPAERYEVIIDFAKYKVGQRVILQSGDLPNNRKEANTDKVMAFDIAGAATDTSNNEIPLLLNPNNEVMKLQASQAARTRKLAFERKNSLWTVNGQTWDDVVNSDYRKVVANPGLNDIEIWELENRSGGWFHPVHIHLIEFKILDRNGKPPLNYEKGPKDVVYVGENETVRVIARYGPHEGRYMMHCHNLVHEDHDMMVQFQVGESRDDNDPRLADPCKDMPDPDFEDEVLEEQQEQAEAAAQGRRQGPGGGRRRRRQADRGGAGRGGRGREHLRCRSRCGAPASAPGRARPPSRPARARPPCRARRSCSPSRCRWPPAGFTSPTPSRTSGRGGATACSSSPSAWARGCSGWRSCAGRRRPWRSSAWSATSAWC
jgi:hypothetical protein